MAADYLRRKGFRLLASNYRKPWGEIDLICQLGHEIVFVEVKARVSLACGHPLESVTPAKRQRLLKAAYSYMWERGKAEVPTRFDLVAICLDSEGRATEITHLENFLENN